MGAFLFFKIIELAFSNKTQHYQVRFLHVLFHCSKAAIPAGF